MKEQKVNKMQSKKPGTIRPKVDIQKREKEFRGLRDSKIARKRGGT